MSFDILGIMGPSKSGKDLVGDWFEKKGFVKIAYADPMKRFAHKLFEFDEKQLWGPSQERNRKIQVNTSWWIAAVERFGAAAEEIVSKVLSPGQRVGGFQTLMDWFMGMRRSYTDEIAPREVLQTLGTEWGRAVDPLLWVKYAHQTVIPSVREGFEYRQKLGLFALDDSPQACGVIIPDHRFVNELKATQEYGGYVIKLKRLALTGETVGIKGHQSESEQLSIPDDSYDLVLEFPEGVDKVYEIIDKAYEEKSWTMKRNSRPETSGD